MTATADVSSRPQEFLGHPTGLYVCFFTEMWERFSFYGMKALLFLYITKYHLFSDDAGYDLLGAYGGLVYAMPILGGLLADRYLGMRKAVVLGGVLLVLGHFGMVFEGAAAQREGEAIVRDDAALQVFYLSLALIVMGVGFLKPNISTIVGRLYPEGDPRRDSGFTLFYAGINIGALFASLICGWLGETYGWRYGFGVAGIGMVLGLAVFLYGQKHLQGLAEPSDPARLARRSAGLSTEQWIYLGSLGGVLVVWQLMQRTWTVHGAMHLVAALFVGWFIWFLARRCTPVERSRMLSLIALILSCLIFFSLYEQTYGSWVAFSDRLMTRSLLGFEMTAGALTFLGAFFVVALAPFFTWLWPWLDRRGLNPSTPLKSAMGLALGGLAFLPMVAAAGIASGESLPSVWWLVLAYGILAAGEMLLSPIGLSAVTQLSVARVVSLMMGAWFLATAYSEVLAASFGKLASIEIPADGSFDRLLAAARYAELFELMVGIGLAAGALALIAMPLIRRGMRGVS